MHLPDIITIKPYLKPNANQAIRTVLHQNEHTQLVLWQIPLDTTLPKHQHPHGTDIWVILQGELTLLDASCNHRTACVGQTVIIAPQSIHGATNQQEEDCILLSIVPIQAGFQAIEDELTHH